MDSYEVDAALPFAERDDVDDDNGASHNVGYSAQVKFRLSLAQINQPQHHPEFTLLPPGLPPQGTTLNRVASENLFSRKGKGTPNLNIPISFNNATAIQNISQSQPKSPTIHKQQQSSGAVFVPGFHSFVHKQQSHNAQKALFANQQLSQLQQTQQQQQQHKSFTNSTQTSPNSYPHTSSTFQQQLLKTITNSSSSHNNSNNLLIRKPLRHHHHNNKKKRASETAGQLVNAIISPLTTTPSAGINKPSIQLNASLNSSIDSTIVTNVRESSHEISKLVLPSVHKNLRIKHPRNLLKLSADFNKPSTGSNENNSINTTNAHIYATPSLGGGGTGVIPTSTTSNHAKTISMPHIDTSIFAASPIFSALSSATATAAAHPPVTANASAFPSVFALGATTTTAIEIIPNNNKNNTETPNTFPVHKVNTLKEIISQQQQFTVKQSEISYLKTGVLSEMKKPTIDTSGNQLITQSANGSISKSLSNLFEKKQSSHQHTRQTSFQYSSSPSQFLPTSSADGDPKSQERILTAMMGTSAHGIRTNNNNNNNNNTSSNNMTQFMPSNTSSHTHSALLSSEKAGFIKEMNARNNQSKSNFYGQFISKCLSQVTTEWQQQKGRNQKIKGDIFEKDFEKIKVSSLLLDVIDKEMFTEAYPNLTNSSASKNNEDNTVHSSTAQSTSFSQPKNPPQPLTQKQKERLFSVLADTEKVIVHTSQNKDLMVPSERKDVVRLASWLEEMLTRIYGTESLDFFEYFENMQLVCSACMSELIRQITVSVSERGTLVKRVWESMLNLMKQGFEQLTAEKTANEHALKQEIKAVHRMYLQRLDECIPTIESLTKQLAHKDLQNKRVVLEFRYLRKKDAKLEKYLRLSKKDLRSIEEEYLKLEKQFTSLKNAIEKHSNAVSQAAVTTETTHKPIVNQSADHITSQAKAHEAVAQKLRQSFIGFNENFERHNKDINSLHEKYVQDVKNFHRNSSSAIRFDEIDRIEESIYAQKDEMEKLMRLEDRVLEEINGADGIKLIIGHCGVQTGPDLLKMTHQSVDTSTLYTCKDRPTQTFISEIDVKEIQTPAEWMISIHTKSPQGSNSNRGKQSSSIRYNQLGESITEIDEEIDESEVAQQRREIDAAEALKLEQMKRVQFRSEDEETEENRRLYEMPFVRDFIHDSPMLQKSGMIFDWKDSDAVGVISSSIKDSKNSVTFQDIDLKLKLQPASPSSVTLNSDQPPSSDIRTQQGSLESSPMNGSGGVQQQAGINSIESFGGIRESISQTVRNNVEKDLEALHTLVMSRTSFVIKICEKIVNFDLLKDNPYVSTAIIDKFILDSKSLILEEHNRLKRIYQRSQRGIIDQVKSKIIIAEKDVELQEIQNDKVMFEHQVKQFRQAMLSLESKNNAEIVQQNSRKRHSQSLNSIEDLSEEDNTNQNDTSSDEIILQETTSINNNITITQNSSNSIAIETSPTKIPQKSKQLIESPTKHANSRKKSTILDKPIVFNKSAQQQLVPATTTAASNTTSLAPPAPPPIKKTKKKETTNPLNRVSISLIQAVQVQKQQLQQQQQQQQQQQSNNPSEQQSNQIENKIEKRFTEITKQSSSQINSSSSNITNGPQQQWLQQRLEISKNRQLLQASPNSDSAAFFFKSIATKYTDSKESNRNQLGVSNTLPSSNMISLTSTSTINTSTNIAAASNNSQSSKKVIMKQQNVLRHVANIYLDKIKSLKNSDEEQSGSRRLNVVTYDYFLNQFGFKKLAETKLKQFLDSCDYYSITFKIRMFTKLYGINRIMNYDFEDFDFFIRAMIFLEEGASPAQLTANVYPLNRAIEALYRFFEGKIPGSDFLRFKTDIENMKIADSTQKQKNKFAIDLDHALDILLQALVEEKKVYIQNIQSVFLAGDVNCDYVIAYDEFITLYRHFESVAFDMLSVTRFYHSNCDLIDRYTGNRIMSFQKFTLEALRCAIFTKEAQDAYAGKIEQFDRIKNIEALEQFWEDKKDVIRLRFVMNQSYRLLYKQMIVKIDQYFSTKKELRKVLDKNTTWFTYRLLDDESKRVMTDAQVNLLVPDEFNLVSDHLNKFVQKISAIL